MTPFDEAINLVILHVELIGAKVSVVNLNDGAGRTCAGITEVNYPSWPGWSLIDHGERLDAPQLLDLIKDFYRREFWGPLQCDQMPARIAILVFGFCVNFGLSNGIKVLQNVVMVNPDGMIGAKTIAAIRNADQNRLDMRLMGAQLAYYRRCKGWKVFGDVWVDRVITMMEQV